MAARAFVPRLTFASRVISAPSRRAIHSALARRAAGSPGTADLVNATQVPVISYKDGERTHEQITVTKPEVVTPGGVDVEHSASALKPEVTAQLTPTMKKFTLHNKIAVITG